MCRDLFYTHTYSHTDILTYTLMHHTYTHIVHSHIYSCISNTHIHIYVHTQSHRNTYIHTSQCPLTLVHIPPHTTYSHKSHAYLCTHSCKHPHTYVHMHAFAHIHTFTHMHTFTYKHTQAHSQACYLLPAFSALCLVLAAPFSAICGVPSVQGVIWD